MSGCALWRVLLPISELQRQGFEGIEWDYLQNDKIDMLFLPEFWQKYHVDAVVLPRVHYPVEQRLRGAIWFKKLHDAGITVLYEMDDDLFSEDFERRLVNHKGYNAKSARERRGNIMHTIQQCDGMTVSSQRLATMARQHVDIPIRVVPNFIDLRWFHEIQKGSKREVPGLTVGWAGGARPDEDLEQMAEAWAILADRYPAVTFVVQGHHAKVIYDKVPNERIAMIDWLPIDGYPAGMKNMDIGCCPLSDTKFNRAKTYIKAMEFAAGSAPVVASPTVYSQIIEHGVDGYIAETVDDWVESLSLLIEDYSHRRQVAKAMLAKLRKHHNLENQAWRWVAAWNELIEVAQAKQAPVSQILLPQGVQVNAYAQ